MAETMDLGDLADIHPTRKKPVGERFAAIALRRAYGLQAPPESGPRPGRVRFSGNEAMIEWTCADSSGLRTVDGAEPAGFEIAGSSGAFVGAEARIEGGRLSLRPRAGEKLGGPAESARHCRRIEQVPNLTDASGIPAGPFGPY